MDEQTLAHQPNSRTLVIVGEDTNSTKSFAASILFQNVGRPLDTRRGPTHGTKWAFTFWFGFAIGPIDQPLTRLLDQRSGFFFVVDNGLFSIRDGLWISGFIVVVVVVIVVVVVAHGGWVLIWCF